MNKNDLKTMVKGKFFTIEFIKNDGTIRKMNARLGVNKYVNGKGKKFNDDDYNLMTVYDVKKKEYRSFKLDKLKSIKFKGETIILGNNNNETTK
jgi:hypothetical protein